jgi:hypothetical protein
VRIAVGVSVGWMAIQVRIAVGASVGWMVIQARIAIGVSSVGRLFRRFRFQVRIAVGASLVGWILSVVKRMGFGIGMGRHQTYLKEPKARNSYLKPAATLVSQRWEACIRIGNILTGIKYYQSCYSFQAILVGNPFRQSFQAILSGNPCGESL